jgi:PAS domain S-box-containing protein
MNKVPTEDAAIYERFFEISADMLCVIDTNGFFLQVNPSLIDTLGYSVDQIVGKQIFDFIHPADIEPTRADLALLLKGKDVQEYENRYRHSGGGYRTLSWTANLDESSNHVYAIARDVTERNVLRNRLLRIENALSDKSILAETDTKGVIIDVNDKFCEISGYSREELLGRTHSVVNSGLHSKKFFKDMWKTIGSGEVWSEVITNRKKDGALYYVHSIIIPFMNNMGKPSGYLAIRQDVTLIVLGQKKLEETLNILNETSAIAKVGGWELDVKTQKLTWTDETFNILEVEQVENRSPMLPEGLALFTDDFKDEVDAAVTRAITTGEPYSMEVIAKTAKGNELWVYTNGKANYENGEIVSLSGTIQDISVRKKAEMKFEAERQIAIQSAKLASLGELSASVAHEINNPLGIISGYTEIMLLSADLPNGFDEKLNSILKSCDRIAHIVNSLKKFSRLDAAVVHSDVALSKIIDEAISLTLPRLKRKGIDIVVNDKPDVVISCVEIEIEQVLLNLINNSIDSIATLSERWIEITMTEYESEVEMKFMDSGLPIPNHVANKLFQPFYTTKVVGKGTGLGLSVISGIIGDHQGSIVVDSKAAHACFVIRLPKVN